MLNSKKPALLDHPSPLDSEPPIRLLIVEDHHIVRQGLVSLLQSVSGMIVVADAADGRHGAELYRQYLPDVVLMDLRMPVVSGVEAIRELCHEFPGAKVVVLTTFDGDEDVYRAMQAGARGYLLKGMEADELTAAIRRVHAGQFSVCSQVAQQLAHRMSTPKLTPREVEVLETLVAGKSNREIASSLNVSEATVKTHLNILFSKLDVVDRTQAAITAVQRGLVHLDFMADKLTFSRSAK